MDHSLLIAFAIVLYCYAFFGLDADTAVRTFFGGVGSGIMCLIGSCLAADLALLLFNIHPDHCVRGLLCLRMAAGLLLSSAPRSLGRMLGAGVRPLLPPRFVFPATTIAYGLLTLEVGGNFLLVAMCILISGLVSLSCTCILFDVCLIAGLSVYRGGCGWLNTGFLRLALTVKLAGGLWHWLLWPPA